MDLEPEGIVPPDGDVVVGNDPVIREIEKLLGEGQLEVALAAIDHAISGGRGNAADLTFLRGDCCLGLGRSVEAEEQFRRVLQGDPDCPSSRCWLAMSLYLQWRFIEAEAAVEAARALPDALVDADAIAGCLAERRGDYSVADAMFKSAALVAPDKYSVPVRLTRSGFDAEVQRAVGQLPEEFRGCLDRVRVIVEDLPPVPEAQVGGGDAEALSPDMLGLFDGVPLPEGGDGAETLGPAAIYLYQRNLERLAHGKPALVQEIRVTLWHELGHYLGFDEEDMGRLGLD